MRRLVVALASVVVAAGCAYLPIARIPADKEGALVVRCREVHGWFQRDQRWLMVVWVWSKSGTIPEHPGNLEVTGSCDWSVARTAIDMVDPPKGPQAPQGPQDYRPPDPDTLPP
jgi:hypothetical protein